MIEIRRLTTLDEFNETIKIQRNAWGFNDLEIDTPDLMSRIQKYGGLVQGLFVDNECIGFSYGFLGTWNAEYFLFSYMTGVMREHQGKGYGFLLKKHTEKKL